jgi:hypothetical protein
MVHGRHCDLAETADSQASHEENATPTDLRDHAAVGRDGDDADGHQDAGVHERASDVRHLEKVSAVCDHEHRARCCLC